MTEPPSTHAPAPAALNILVVDDSAVMRKVITRAAALTGLSLGQIFEAANGQEALAILEQQHLDALFTDIAMPVMTGLELLRQMEGQKQWEHILRVIVSTDGSDARRAEAEALRVGFYITKPFRPEVVRDVLSHFASAS